VLPNPVLGDVAPSQEEMFTHLMMGDPDHDPTHHVEQGMGGLMMATQVNAPDGWEPYDGPRRQMRLLIQSDSLAAPEGASHLATAAPYRRRFAYVLQEGDADPAPDSVRLPGSTLVLHKDEPTSIWVVNRTPEPSAVHWHGLELDSYFDGVVGIGGVPSMITPPVMPGDSFEVRLTPPRAGSFMYHTHVNDVRQLSGGLYAPIVITEEAEPWDTSHDKVFILGWAPDQSGVFLNGEQAPEPLEVVAGESYRFRLMNITLGNPGLRFKMLRNGDTWFWTPIAKDGFDLPEHQQILSRAEQRVGIGETIDMEVSFRESGEYVLEVRGDGGFLAVSQPVTVLAAGN
jgi:FtsP/CotA-like multicopper oxidase with cupredoxin domain